MLDCKYGLKPEHNIDTFHNFFLNNMELFQNLVSTDPMRSSYAIANLCFTYFDDLHSGFTRGGYLFDRNADVESIISMSYLGPSIRKSFKLGSLYENARKAVYRAWVPGYEEVGDTAFITFDHFTANRPDYYDMMIDRDNPQDTIDLIIYANSQIKREGSPIKNIVIDLSNTGGGSCVVQPCTTAAGTIFQISGNKQVSIIKNGSFYNTDAGVEPDFRLEKPESFYDRPALVEYLHNLK